MIIIGADYHPSFQTIAFLIEETGEYDERELNHSEGEAERFYRDLGQRGIRVRVGQESRNFGSAIMVRAKTGVPGLPSGVLSYLRLFSSDGVPLAKRLGQERGCKSKDSRSGGGAEHSEVSWYRRMPVGTS